MSAVGTTLLHSPGRKPWGIIVNIFIVPLQGRHYSRQRQMLAPKVPLLRSSYFLCPCLPRVSFRALPSFHPGLCRSVVPTALVISLNFDALALRTTNRIQQLSLPLNQQCPRWTLINNTYQSFIPHIEIPLINQAKAKTMFPILKTSAKSVQTTRVVCTNYG